MDARMAQSRLALQETIQRAMSHQRDNDLVRAQELYREALAEDPHHLVALHLLSAVLLQTGRNEEAVDLLLRATSLAPNQAMFFANLGEAHRRLGNLANAKECLRRAIALKSDLAEAHYTLGLTMNGEGRPHEAIACFERAASLKPDLLPVYVGLATALLGAGRLDDARQACARALEMNPTFADAHNQLGVVIKEQGRIEDAVVSFRRALECRPDHRVAHGNLVYALPWHPGQDAESIAREAIRWREQHLAAASPRRPHANDRDPDRRLRVGYVSPDFRFHCQALFLVPLLEHHDRRAVEVFCYSFVTAPDEITDRIRGLSDKFRDITARSDAEAAEEIRGDRIDVLVDLTMHMGENRIGLYASKPAPVQVAWLAYPGTTGLDVIDYRITDVFLDPPEIDVSGWYTEHSVRLPDSFWCYDPLTREPEVSPLPALGDGKVTFGCLNNFGKTNAGVFALWSQVLQRVPGSRLLVLAQPGEPRARVRDAFSRAGVDPERIEFVGYQPRSDYLSTYSRIDVTLDTFPYNGHTTSLDSLWMGVPVVTLVGRTVVGRAGLCFARNLGLDELVATTPERYVAIAAELARNLPRLQRLRADLRGRMRRSALMDGPRFAHSLESAFRWMWRRWCAAPIPG
jgi:protein O-GlcNAc transferase